MMTSDWARMGSQSPFTGACMGCQSAVAHEWSMGYTLDFTLLAFPCNEQAVLMFPCPWQVFPSVFF